MDPFELQKGDLQKVREFLGREPTRVETVIFAIQGSEHCSYKSSKRFLKNLPLSSEHVILGPGEDSGIIAITDRTHEGVRLPYSDSDAPVPGCGPRWCIAIAHESHNHPSQIVPYEGAATGIGGVVRDVLCMGARVIGCLDMLRFGDLKKKQNRTIAQEVIRGIGGYGNPIGVPNLGGSTMFDSGYNSNCLVNAVAIGLVQEDEIIHSIAPTEAGNIGYDIIIIGKPTDRSGFGGAAFASESFEEGTLESKSGAVQEPNPFLERHLMASTYELFDWLKESMVLSKVSFKDLGAGGIVCASVEQIATHNFGAEIELERVHVSIPDLLPEVIACAETQERLCWMCHPDLTEHILTHYNETWDLPSIAQNARASVIGKVTDDGMYRLRFKGEVVCEAKSKDITYGIEYSEKERPTKVSTLRHTNQSGVMLRCSKGASKHYIGLSSPQDDTFVGLSESFYNFLHDPNHASKHPIFLHYDKNVIGNTVLEPGEADAAVIMPLQDISPNKAKNATIGVALSTGGPIHPDPYEQGKLAAKQAIHKVAAVGAEPRALTDCLNYGNPEIPEQLWELEQGIKGIADVSKETGVPVISGNVSLYNCDANGNVIPPSAICCCVGVIPNAHDAVSMQLKKGGSSLFIANSVSFIISCIQEKLILSCHYANEDVILSLFEMTTPQRKTGGHIGVDVEIRSDEILSTPNSGHFPKGEGTFESGFIFETGAPDEIQRRAEDAGILIQKIGKTTNKPRFLIRMKNETLISETLEELFSAWDRELLETLPPSR